MHGPFSVFAPHFGGPLRFFFLPIANANLPAIRFEDNGWSEGVLLPPQGKKQCVLQNGLRYPYGREQARQTHLGRSIAAVNA